MSVAKRGDFLVYPVQHSADYIAAHRDEWQDFRVGLVSSVDKQGRTKSFRFPVRGSHVVDKNVPDKIYIVKREAVHADALEKALIALPWPQSFELLQEVRDFIKPFLIQV